uniref:BTB domain-containing protein n=1 Tax=Branchiostoma floridae TaxID=7739 RepID=C3YNC0_BRAFL|eukprot:XP_002602214.1 hypothetical protein BRAFLDRAFT_76902 [Branchiostoma floridae]
MAAAEPHASAVRPRSYQDESYLRGFLGAVDDLQKAGVLQDVVLEVEGRRFPCHRLVLSAASPYFRDMFTTSDMAESRQKTVVLEGLDAGMFGEILSYIYSGTLHVSLDKVQPLYQAADLLQLDYVRDTCSSYMAMNVDRSTCMDLYKFADVYSVEIVRKSCLQWIARHLTEVASSEGFCSLSVNQLTEIISHDELDVKEETTVWEAVVRWVQYSREDRLHHLSSILPHIRLNLLTSDDKAAILEHPLVREDPGSYEFIRKQEQKGNSKLKPRLGMTTEMVLLSHAFSRELLFMNPREGKYVSCKYREEDLPFATDVTVTSDNNIYILNRDRERNDQLSVFKYSHAENVWEYDVMGRTPKRVKKCSGCGEPLSCHKAGQYGKHCQGVAKDPPADKLPIELEDPNPKSAMDVLEQRKAEHYPRALLGSAPPLSARPSFLFFSFGSAGSGPDESYIHGFLGSVDDLQKAGVLQDVVLEVEGRRFPCHRLVLSAASPYFRAMFTSDMAESRQKTVVLQGLDAGMFGEILSYIYSGTLHVSLDKVQPLYQAADLLQLDYVRDTCSSYMAMNVEHSTFVDLYNFAAVFSVDTVLWRCVEWIDINFVEFSFGEEFCCLSVNQLTEIISHDELDVKEESTVWEAVVRWAQHSREDRLHHLPIILPHIRFNLLTSDDTTAMLGHSLVKENPGSYEVIQNVVQKGNLNLKPRIGMTTEMALVYNAAPGSNELLFMNPQEGKYISCSYKPEDLPKSSIMTVTSDNDIYILQTKGSEEKNKFSLFKYKHAENMWEQAGVPLISKGPDDELYEEHLFKVDGTLHYLAVYDGRSLLQMRKYNPHTNQWQECSQLQLDTTFEDAAALPCGSHIYFLSNEEVHRYEPSEDRWSKRTPPGVIHSVCTAAAMGTEIFCTDFDFTQTMVYDTESDRWQKLQGWENPENLNTDHFPILFVLENQLHILLTCVSDLHDDMGFDAGMFGEILSYIYSGTLHVSLDKMQPLYQAADLL